MDPLPQMLSGKNQKGIDMDANEQKKTPVCAESQMENPADAQSNSDHSFAKAVNTGSIPAVRQGLRIAGAVFYDEDVAQLRRDLRSAGVQIKE